MNKLPMLLRSAVAVAVGASAFLLLACTPASKPCVRTVSINDVSASEGGSNASPGTYTDFVFTVSSAGCGAPGQLEYSIDYKTTTATAGNDYVLVSGLLTFIKNDMSDQTVPIKVLSDARAEPVESFAVCLRPIGGADSKGSSPTSAQTIELANKYGMGLILDDDSNPPQTTPPQRSKELHCSR